MAAEGDPSQAAATSQKKLKISYDEYQNLASSIVSLMKQYEVDGKEHVQQADLINRMVQKLMLEDDSGMAPTDE